MVKAAWKATKLRVAQYGPMPSWKAKDFTMRWRDNGIQRIVLHPANALEPRRRFLGKSLKIRNLKAVQTFPSLLRIGPLMTRLHYEEVNSHTVAHPDAVLSGLSRQGCSSRLPNSRMEAARKEAKNQEERIIWEAENMLQTGTLEGRGCTVAWQSLEHSEVIVLTVVVIMTSLHRWWVTKHLWTYGREKRYRAIESGEGAIEWEERAIDQVFSKQYPKKP